MSINDNEPGAPSPKPLAVEAHGHAALTLVESLIHGLISKSVLTSEESLDIVETAADVQADYAADAGEAKRAPGASEVLLARMASSLRTDIDPPFNPTKHYDKPRLLDVNDPSFDASVSTITPPTNDGVGK